MEPTSTSSCPPPQYNEDIAQLNDLASERPRMALVAGIQQENKHIMDLQQENRDLKIALEEQQNAIDLIMSKYRQHVSKLMQCQKYDQQLLKSMDTNTKVNESEVQFYFYLISYYYFMNNCKNLIWFKDV